MPPPLARSGGRASKSIVVVDDSGDLAASVALLLEHEGYVATFAVTGAEGLELMASGEADAILLDYMLPDMTGADIAIALRADPARRHVHIIMCTGTDEVTVRKTFTDYHAFLAKPVALADLVRSLDRAFAKH